MIETLVEKTLRRERLVTGAAIAIIAMLAWAYLIVLSRQMSAGSAAMSDMAAMAMPEPGWDTSRFLLTFTMWSVMMVAMMLPSAAPVVLLYARVGRAAAERGTVFAPTFWFAAGYTLAWVGF